MIAPSTQSKLSLLLPNQNKVLSEILKQATPQQLVQLNENKDIKSILNSLFHSKIDNSKSDMLLLELLKNSPVFKNMGNFTENLKSLLTDLKSDSSLEHQVQKLTTSVHPTSLLDIPVLKEKISNSGIFMESKIALLLNASESKIESEMGNDVKSQLLALKEELTSTQSPENDKLQQQIDKLITHIEYHQLLSHLNDSNSLYLPFAWDGLEKGSLEFKKKRGDTFYCEINLTLKEYGKIDLFMGISQTNQLDIHIRTEKSELKTLLEHHLSALRSLLIDSGLIPRAIRIVDDSELVSPMSSAYGSNESDSHPGFEVKV
ncbi:MAG TPA: flagellar hook-length control protein FliK [Sulfuricurvum sp.]|nr:flagellar hook-length control protein FliK [Sulfuricurvum sp.]